MTTCVYIRWPWIIFPAVTIRLSGIFPLSVVLENRGIETDCLWKSSFLSALFCETEVPQQSFGKGEMRAIAKSTIVCLEDGSGELRLKVN